MTDARPEQRMTIEQLLERGPVQPLPARAPVQPLVPELPDRPMEPPQSVVVRWTPVVLVVAPAFGVERCRLSDGIEAQP